MTLKQLLLELGELGIKDKMINYSCAGGSVYEINNLTIKNYPMLYISPTGNHRARKNFTEYNLTLFYIDRLLEDSSNDVDIYSTAVEVLKNIIKKAGTLDGVIKVDSDYQINLFTETERMSDRCSGAYAQVNISVMDDTICPVD